MELGLAAAMAIGFALFFGAGIAVNHVLATRAFRKHVCSIVSSEDHQAEGHRLIHLALRTSDDDYARYLRTQAYIHFQSADILDNGPYKT